MDLVKYFEETRGTGFLGTADAEGKVNIALYARPHVIDGSTVAFIMADRLSHHNLESNGMAAYLYLEEGEGRRGVRLYLKKTRESDDPAEAAGLRRRPLSGDRDTGKRFVVYFNVEKTIPLQGSEAGEADQ